MDCKTLELVLYKTIRVTSYRAFRYRTNCWRGNFKQNLLKNLVELLRSCIKV